MFRVRQRWSGTLRLRTGTFSTWVISFVLTRTAGVAVGSRLSIRQVTSCGKLIGKVDCDCELFFELVGAFEFCNRRGTPGGAGGCRRVGTKGRARLLRRLTVVRQSLYSVSAAASLLPADFGNPTSSPAAMILS